MIANRSALWRYGVRIVRIVLIVCLLVSTYRHASGLVLQAQGRDDLRDALVLPTPEPEEPQEESPAVWPPYAPAMAPELSRATLESWNCDYPPPLPAAFWGAVTLNGENVSAGTPITAWIDNVQVASTEAQIYEGASVYNIDIPADDPCTAGRQGGSDGETVRFKIEDSWARETGVWKSGAVVERNLKVQISLTGSDIDGDDKTDLVLFRPNNSVWDALLSSKGYTLKDSFSTQFGWSTDTPLLGDVDGDGKADLIVRRPGNSSWHVLLSSTGYDRRQALRLFVGDSSDVPLVGDIDGDGRADLVLFRPSTSTWHALLSSKGYTARDSFSTQFGWSTDIPLLGDVDGDGKADLIVRRPGNSSWHVLLSSTGYDRRQALRLFVGASSDVPVR